VSFPSRLVCRSAWPRTLVAAGLVAIAAAGGCLKPAGVRYPNLPTVADGALQIIAFDVGQADATLVLYKGRSLLIDCGAPMGQPQRASQRIPRRLDALVGSRRIDYFLVTHYHQDHFGGPGHRPNQHEPAGIFSLIERDGLTIGTVLDRGFYSASAKGSSQLNYERAIGEWIAAGVASARREVRAGELIDMGEGLEVKVITSAANGYLDRLHTLYPTWVDENPPSENDYSIGLKLTLGDFEMFTAGDLSGHNVVRHFGPKSSSYNDIETQVAGNIGAVEVYRASHHGSENSSNPCFAEVLHPLVTIFSTGYNGYGHPAAAVYRRFKGYGPVYITGGAALSVRAEVESDIVGDDVEVLVAPDGKRFWVNGTPFQSLTDAQEAARPRARDTCRPPDVSEIRPDTFKTTEDSPGD
jgi:beta-lactamase superfamily II metal-dependent hydrolase